MCGVVGLFGRGWPRPSLGAATGRLEHRGPDGTGLWRSASGWAALGHRRLAVVDLSSAAGQPMTEPSGRWWLSFNGEIYNHAELRRALPRWPFRTHHSDAEVALAALATWGPEALHRFLGMFALLLWDDHEHTLLAARDRFGVKPLLVADGGDERLALASEHKALHAAGVEAEPNLATWAGWLTEGRYGTGGDTFWTGITEVPAGGLLTWRPGGRPVVSRWYDVAARTETLDDRPVDEVAAELEALLVDAVDLRFRADVPTGVNLSGGLDSSTLAATMTRLFDGTVTVPAFTFTTGDPAYDETPWVAQLIGSTGQPWHEVRLDHAAVPDLARSVLDAHDEPYGGLPTLAYASLFERAREAGVTVLLDGQGMDEAWGGYDYYRSGSASLVQGSADSPTRPEALDQAFASSATHGPPRAVGLRAMQLRDLTDTKLPRALRFADRASMRSSIELREPFCDHRLVELGLRQPDERKLGPNRGKELVRQVLGSRLPGPVVEAPKRPVQTPQREWLRGPLRGWADDLIETALAGPAGGWFDPAAVRSTWRDFADGRGDNSFFVWQWLTLGMRSPWQPTVGSRP